MSDEHAPRRLFSEKEISRVLKRATELQEAEGPTETTDFSMEELQQIAAEVGIDPRHLAVAVAELEQDDDARFHWLGAPTSFELERIVEGEVSEEQWQEMVLVIRQAFDLVGGAGRVGRSFEWTHDSKDQQAQVTVTSQGGQTKIRLFAHYPNAAALTFMTSTILAMMAAGSLAGFLAPSAFLNFWTFVVGLLAASFMVARFVFARMIGKKQHKTQQLLARLEQIVAEPATEATPTPLPEATARLDASLLTEEAEPEEAPRPTETRTKTSS